MAQDKYQIVQIDPLSLVIEIGFNPREAVIGNLGYELEPVKSTITAIKQAYKEGRRVDLIKVVLKNGQYIVRQGHCRTHALKLALSEGAAIPSISVILLAYDNEIEEYLENVDGNRSNGLNPVSQAHALSHAVKMGYSVESLAQRYQRSTTAIRNMLKILEMPFELQRLISMGEIKKTLAIEIMLRYSNDHEKVLANLKSHLDIAVQPVTTTNPVNTTIVSDSVCAGEPVMSANNTKEDRDDKGKSRVQQNVTKSVTRSSLGIKRLSQKKTERLKSGFLSLTTALTPDTYCNDCVTQVKISKQHKDLFSGLDEKYVTDDGNELNLSLSESNLKILLAILSDESTVIVIPKSSISELNEIRDMLISSN
ncbi:hypothetical protein I7V28_19330 [Lelliottia amnigena]|uniref:ParB/RepB/Spo0J family partition protein n=1 Tax=Lelliottia TaxID=1330545 RepID=UPI00192CA774|nr:hypothetical protein [Lelliottia aquatilis]MBL5923235.1 hypothetical protein [Lelliottia amnigena]MBL5932145.1 hypothetical protein [Lelliottia amnigena]